MFMKESCLTLAMLTSALSRCTGTMADALQAAAYHRRWSLTCGAPNVAHNVMLRAPLVGATNAVGISDTKADIVTGGEPTTTFKPWEGAPIVIDESSSDDDDDDKKKKRLISLTTHYSVHLKAVILLLI